MAASSRDGGWKPKYWYCGISSMFCSSAHQVERICVGPTVLCSLGFGCPEKSPKRESASLSGYIFIRKLPRDNRDQAPKTGHSLTSSNPRHSEQSKKRVQ